MDFWKPRLEYGPFEILDALGVNIQGCTIIFVGPVAATPNSDNPDRTSGMDTRPASVVAQAKGIKVPSVPMILFIGGPGGGKTKHAVRAAQDLADQGLVHICLPKLIRNGISMHKNEVSEWKDAADKYESGGVFILQKRFVYNPPSRLYKY